MNSKKINDFAKAIVTETAEAVNLAQAMIADAELAAKAEAEARHHTNCRNCQAEMVNWRIANPTACEAAAETAHHEIWAQCPVCVAEYSEWAAKVPHRSLPEVHAYNGDDLRWQNGGTK